MVIQPSMTKDRGLLWVTQTVKNLPAMQETCETWVRKIPWGREGQPTPGFLLEEFHRQRSLAGYKESHTNEPLTLSLSGDYFRQISRKSSLTQPLKRTK